MTNIARFTIELKYLIQTNSIQTATHTIRTYISNETNTNDI